MLVMTLMGGYVSAQEHVKVRMSATTTQGDRINGYVFIKSPPSFFTVYYNEQDSIILNANLVRYVSLRPIDQKETNGFNRPQENRRPRLKYFNNTNVGILSGKTNDDSNPVASLSVQTINGISLYQYLSIGIGVAYDQYNTTSTLPFFLSLRGDVLDRMFTPYYFVDFGYGSAWDNSEENIGWEFLDVEGGFMFHSGIGFKMYSGDRVNVMIAFGYKQQKTVYRNLEWNGGERVTDRTYKRLSFSIGIGF